MKTNIPELLKQPGLTEKDRSLEKKRERLTIDLEKGRTGFLAIASLSSDDFITEILILLKHSLLKTVNLYLLLNDESEIEDYSEIKEALDASEQLRKFASPVSFLFELPEKASRINTDNTVELVATAQKLFRRVEQETLGHIKANLQTSQSRWKRSRSRIIKGTAIILFSTFAIVSWYQATYPSLKKKDNIRVTILSKNIPVSTVNQKIQLSDSWKMYRITLPQPINSFDHIAIIPFKQKGVKARIEYIKLIGPSGNTSELLNLGIAKDLKPIDFRKVKQTHKFAVNPGPAGQKYVEILSQAKNALLLIEPEKLKKISGIEIKMRQQENWKNFKD